MSNFKNRYNLIVISDSEEEHNLTNISLNYKKSHFFYGYKRKNQASSQSQRYYNILIEKFLSKVNFNSKNTAK